MKYIKKDLPYQKDKIKDEDLDSYVRILLNALNNNNKAIQMAITYNETTYIKSADQPTPRPNTFILWDNTNGSYYLVANFNGVIKKVLMQ